MAASAPSQPYVVNYADMRLLDFPVSGAGANIPIGTVMIPGVSAGTNVGVAIPATATSVADCLGLLAEQHVFSGNNSSGDATTQTLVQWFQVGAANSGTGTTLGVASVSGVGGPYPSHRMDLLDSLVAVKMDYAIADATSFTLTSISGANLVLNNTSWAGSLDSSFVYFSAGTAIGELGFIKSSVASTSGTLISALSTTPVALDTMILILPLFNQTPTLLVNSATQPTKLDTNLAAGTVTAAVIANFISQNGLINRLDPKVHHKSTNLNKLNQLGFFAYLSFFDSQFHPGS